MGITNRFAKGSGCYKCISCGKLTRNTHGCITSKTCERCYDMAGDENAVCDGDMTREEFAAKWGQEYKK